MSMSRVCTGITGAHFWFLTKKDILGLVQKMVLIPEITDVSQKTHNDMSTCHCLQKC